MARRYNKWQNKHTKKVETPLQEAPLVVSHTVPSKTRPLELYPESPNSTIKQKVRTQLAVLKGGRRVYWCVRCGHCMHTHMTCTCTMCVKESKVGATLELLWVIFHCTDNSCIRINYSSTPTPNESISQNETHHDNRTLSKHVTIVCRLQTWRK
jgi:hypothetical protein